MPEQLRQAPSLNVEMRESPLYRVMGVGLTDRIVFVGHGSPINAETNDIELNKLHPVNSVQEIINKFQGDTDCPLIRAMVAAYYAGARDIWLVAAAPMDEYELNIDNRDNAYYELYKQRLEATLERLPKSDIPQIVVPLEAPFNSDIDFLEPFADYAQKAYEITGVIPMILMGTRGSIDENLADELSIDPRLPLLFPPGEPTQTDLSDPGKFVSIFIGDGVYNLKEFPTSFVASVTPVIAGILSKLPIDRGITYKRLEHISTVEGADLSKETINKLAKAKLNVVGRNTRGKRGELFNVVSFTDNTLADDGSDYWSLTQIRLVSKIVDQIRTFGYQRLGSISYGIFVREIEEYLSELLAQNIIKEIDFDIRRDESDPTHVFINLNITPFYGTRTVHVMTKVGPSEGTL